MKTAQASILDPSQNLFRSYYKKLEVNYDFIKKYLFLGYKSLFKKNESFFKKIKQVPAGTFLSYKNDQKNIKNY